MSSQNSYVRRWMPHRKPGKVARRARYIPRRAICIYFFRVVRETAEIRRMRTLARKSIAFEMHIDCIKDSRP